MNVYERLALALDPTLLMVRAGMVADDWQRDLLMDPDGWWLMLCSRQSGKTTVLADPLNEIHGSTAMPAVADAGDRGPRPRDRPQPELRHRVPFSRCDVWRSR